MWDSKKSSTGLAEHKDVDAVVLNFREGAIRKKFEGGIDWWSTEHEVVEVPHYDNFQQMRVDFHRNGNGVVLYYRIDARVDGLAPGLYVPDSYFVSCSELNLAGAIIELSRKEVEDEVVDFMADKLAIKNPRDNLDPAVLQVTKGEFSKSIETYQLSAEEIRAIKKTFGGGSPF